MFMTTIPRSRAIPAVSLLAGALCLPSFAQEEVQGPGVERPNYKFLRSLEDWSVLGDFSEEDYTDPWDGIKFVPLTDDKSVWASFGGHLRLRVEDWTNFGFGSALNDSDTFVLWRMTLHADVHFGDNVRAFVEGKSALSTDRDLPGGRRAADVDTIALEQAFVDIVIPVDGSNTLTLRPGRQVLMFGKQRLVSPLGWSNTLRRWDGFIAILNWDAWTVHAFYTQFVPVQKYDFNDPTEDTELYGVYATGRIADSGVGIDGYFLRIENTTATFNGTTGGEDRNTIGSRIFGKLDDSGIDYDLEVAYQFGEVGTGDISAYMIGSQLGFKPRRLPGTPRFFIGFDYGSGDDSTGGDVGTFNHLFPLGHAYLGYIDVVGRQNIVDLSGGLTFSPMQKMTAGVTGHLFWRDDTSDGLYNAGGGVVRGGGIGTAREIGQEIDATIRYKFNTHLTGLFGYSHFFAGDFISETGSSDDIDFIYAQLQYTF